MRTIRDIEFLEGVKVLVRADFNVPIKNGAVADDFRIRAALPTIEFLRSKGACVVLMSHLESNDGDNPPLEPIARHLNDKLGLPVIFIKDLKSAHEIIEAGATEKVTDGKGKCFLLENLRFFDGEKDNDKKFAKQLASLGDIFVNDAFSVCHREHASVVGVPKFLPSYAGLQLEKEVTNLSRAFDAPHPFLFVLGGAKFETKLPLVDKFMGLADIIFIGGALVNDLFKEKGYEIGRSRVSDSEKIGDFNLSKYIDSPKLVLPVDVVNQDKEAKMADALSPTDAICDAGPKTMALLKGKVGGSKFILWNGPLGMYEKGYTGPTSEVARMIAEETARGAETIVGGGDTLAAISDLGIEDKFTFVSTGGGAMLEFLAKGTLPGIEALAKSE